MEAMDTRGQNKEGKMGGKSVAIYYGTHESGKGRMHSAVVAEPWDDLTEGNNRTVGEGGWEDKGSNGVRLEEGVNVVRVPDNPSKALASSWTALALKTPLLPRAYHSCASISHLRALLHQPRLINISQNSHAARKNRTHVGEDLCAPEF